MATKKAKKREKTGERQKTQVKVKDLKPNKKITGGVIYDTSPSKKK